jgi:TrmH family RNA methyltransferase
LELVAVREGDSFEASAAQTVTLSRSLFRSLSQTVTPQGVFAIGKVSERSFREARVAAQRAGWPLVVLDGVQDPGNVGTIIRSAVAAGAPAVVILPRTADPFGPKAVRASAGQVLRVVIARASWGDFAGLRGMGASSREGVPYQESAIEAGDFLVFGSEVHGLSGPEPSASMDLVTVPMSDHVESLNVGAAAAVLLFEVRRRLTA